jgi:hypothetical protein
MLLLVANMGIATHRTHVYVKLVTIPLTVLIGIVIMFVIAIRQHALHMVLVFLQMYALAPLVGQGKDATCQCVTVLHKVHHKYAPTTTVLASLQILAHAILDILEVTAKYQLVMALLRMIPEYVTMQTVLA